MSTNEDFITCSSCGTVLDTSADVPDTREPCPNCGNAGRVFNAHVSETRALRDGMALKAFRAGEKRPHVEGNGTRGHGSAREKADEGDA